MEFRLVFGDVEDSIGDYKTQEIAPLVMLLKASKIIAIEGDAWVVEHHDSLYFNTYPPYFYLSLTKEE